MDFLVTFVLLVVVGVPVFMFTRKRIANRLEKGGAYEVALRVVEGTEGGLTEKWRHGQVKPSLASLQFRPGGPGGVRIPVGQTSTIPVVGVEIRGVRRPSLRNAWSINPTLRVIGIRTPNGLLDLACQADVIPKITNELGFGVSQPT